MSDFAGVQISSEQFSRLAQACRHDPTFPTDHEGWLQLASIKQSVREARPIELNVDSFLEWCARLDIPPCLDAVRAYVLARSHATRNAFYGSVDLRSRRMPFDPLAEPPYGPTDEKPKPPR